MGHSRRLLGVIFLALAAIMPLVFSQGNGQDFRQIIAPLEEVLGRQCKDNQCESVQGVSRQLLDGNLQDLEMYFRSPYSFVFDPEFHRQFTLAVQDQRDKNASSRCLEDITRLFEDLLQRKSYTFQVIDAIGKLSSGVSQGNFMWLGSYDLCTNITEYKSNISQEIRFQGRHCLATLKGPVLGPLVGMLGISVGICVPDRCSGTDLKPVVDIGIKLVLQHLNISSKVKNKTVQASGVSCAQPAVWTNGDTAATVVTAIIVLLGLCGSLYDIVRRGVSTWRKAHTGTKPVFPVTSSDSIDVVNSDTDKLVSDDFRGPHTQSANEAAVSLCNAATIKEFFHQFLISFSAIANAEKLLNTSMREGQLGAVNGIRVISMWWVILGHTYTFVGTGKGVLLDNVIAVESLLKRFTFEAILNGTYSVDSFFYLSGLLMAYLLLRELKKSDGKTNWGLLYFHRYWRLTPAYMFVLLLYSTLYLHLPQGPFMRSMDNEAVQCEKYWWTNLLYINNFVPRKLTEECMAWSWYLANDMQFFIISPIIIYLLYRFRYIGYTLVSALILTCLIVTGVKSRLGHNGSFFTYNDASNEIYVYPWHRISPYLVGITTGYLIHLWENNGRPKIYKICVVIGWSLAIAINMSVLYGVYGPNSTGIPWNDDVNALYTATSRFAWSLGLGWLTYACITGYGGPVNVFLSWGVWAPLGRLTYCAYLVHPIIIYNYYLSRTTLLHYTDYNVIYIYIGNVVVSYLVAFVVSVAVEAPMMGLEKLIFKRKKDSCDRGEKKC